MKKHIDAVGALRIQAKQLAIESMGEPRNRMPVRFLRGRKGPDYGVPSKSRTNLRVVGNVDNIVEIEKRGVRNGVVDGNRREGQQQADD